MVELHHVRMHLQHFRDHQLFQDGRHRHQGDRALRPVRHRARQRVRIHHRIRRVVAIPFLDRRYEQVRRVVDRDRPRHLVRLVEVHQGVDRQNLVRPNLVRLAVARDLQ